MKYKIVEKGDGIFYIYKKIFLGWQQVNYYHSIVDCEEYIQDKFISRARVKMENKIIRVIKVISNLDIK